MAGFTTGLLTLTWALAFRLSRVGALHDVFDVREATIDSLHDALFTGTTTCREVVSSFIARIEQFNPTINAVISLNPNALAVADGLDVRIAGGNVTGPLFCVPVLLKDNFDAVGMITTGGCRALADNIPSADAPTVRALVDAGAVILGKTNLHEMALEGLSVSSLGGQTINPYDLTRTPGGSSGGSGAAVAASFAVFATGTDTVNSLRSPASANSLFSMRPTRGLITRAGVIPVSFTQDTVGAMARNIRDLAVAVTVMASAATDVTRDNVTELAPPEVRHRDYSAGLYKGSLQGLRFGLLHGFFNYTPSAETTPVNEAMADVVSRLTNAGAVVVNITDPAYDTLEIAKLDVQAYEYREVLDNYLSNSAIKRTTTATTPTSFHDLYTTNNTANNTANSTNNFLVIPAQHAFLRRASHSSTSNTAYLATLAHIRDLTHTLSATFTQHNLTALLYPEQKNLPVHLGAPSQSGRNGILAALTGHPVVCVPAGFSPPTGSAPVGVPIGMEILGRLWSEDMLLNIASLFSELVKVRRMPPLVGGVVEARGYGVGEGVVPVVTPDVGGILEVYPLGVY